MSVRAASQLAGNVAAIYGMSLRADAQAATTLRFVFPSPDRLAAADLAATTGIPTTCATAISTLAAAASANPALLEPSECVDDTIARLTALSLSPWTAQYIVMRALHEPDAFPAPDVSRVPALATSETWRAPTELFERALTWRPWRAYAALHLWTAGRPARANGRRGGRITPLCGHSLPF
jgi:3-methyladenine DNA glycosylase/8-oxoguanine DNA glycosylase